MEYLIIESVGANEEIEAMCFLTGILPPDEGGCVERGCGDNCSWVGQACPDRCTTLR